MPSASSTPQPFALYNPALLSPEALLGEFIARQPLLESLLDAVRQNRPGHAPQHLLLVGPRGMGKTTTLWAVAHRVNRDPALAKAWLPVVFDEESRRVGDLADFWLEAVRQWEHATQSPEDRTRPLLDRPGHDIEDRARQAFLDALAHDGRRVLLLIDNLNDVLASIHDPEPLHRLRAFLMDESRVMIIGGATRYFPEITDLDQPFYDFFRSFELKPLTLEEMKDCLLTLAKTRGDAAVEKTIREREGTLRSLHLLTGGNPRLIKTFYRLIAEGLRGDIRTDLERLLDEFTPYFKSIVDALPVQQQRIFDAIALHWDPVDVAAVVRATRVASNQVSAQIRMLVKAGHVVEAAGQPKKKTYLLADRFSNIHYLMRHGRAARRRFDWFVAILRLVFPDRDHADTLAKLARQSAECGADGLRDARDLLFSALRRSETEKARSQLLHATFREGWDNDTFTSFSQWLDLNEARQHLPECDILAFFQDVPTEIRRRLTYKPHETEWWCEVAAILEARRAWILAKKAYSKAIELETTNTLAWVGVGMVCKHRLNEKDQAKVAFTKATELAPSSPFAWVMLAEILDAESPGAQGAREAFEKAVRIDPTYGFAWICYGEFLSQLSTELTGAEHAFREAVKVSPHDSYAWSSLGDFLMTHTAKLAEAEGCLKKSLEFGSKQSDYTLTCLADLISRNSARIPEAREYALAAILKAPDSPYAQLVFKEQCRGDLESWRAVIPALLTDSTDDNARQVRYEMLHDGMLELSRNKGLSNVLDLIETLPSASTHYFETLRDALIAHDDRAHLDRLAPERRVVVIELLKRLTEKSDAAAESTAEAS